MYARVSIAEQHNLIKTGSIQYHGEQLLALARARKLPRADKFFRLLRLLGCLRFLGLLLLFCLLLCFGVRLLLLGLARRVNLINLPAGRALQPRIFLLLFSVQFRCER